MELPAIYLVGAIRDGRQDDIDWRENVIDLLDDQAVFLNPLGGKTFDATSRQWSMSGISPAANVIVKHDFWCVDHADMIIANMTSLSEGYPSIGSLIELGRATLNNKLIYLILESGYTGHGNQAMFKLHPFLQEIAAATFTSVESCIDFLGRHLDVMNGVNPRFDGVINEPIPVMADAK